MTVEIPLGTVRRCKHTGKYVALVDSFDEAWVRKFNWTADLSRGGQRVYAVRRKLCEDGVKRKVYLHRELWEHLYGRIPFGMQVDHKSHGAVSGLDNRRTNLRLAVETLNAANQRRRSDNTSGHKGVSFDVARGKWFAYINCGGQRTRLGFHASVLDAAAAYNAAAREMFGEFALLNDIEVPA